MSNLINMRTRSQKQVCPYFRLSDVTMDSSSVIFMDMYPMGLNLHCCSAPHSRPHGPVREDTILILVRLTSNGR